MRSCLACKKCYTQYAIHAIQPSAISLRLIALLSRVPSFELRRDQLLVLSQALGLVSDPDTLHVTGSIWSGSNF